MPRGIALLDGVRQVLLHMHRSLGLNVKEIVYLTNIPQCTVYPQQTPRSKAEQLKHEHIERRGRPRKLDFADTQVCPPSSFLRHSLLIKSIVYYEINYAK